MHPPARLALAAPLVAAPGAAFPVSATRAPTQDVPSAGGFERIGGDGSFIVAIRTRSTTSPGVAGAALHTDGHGIGLTGIIRAGRFREADARLYIH